MSEQNTKPLLEIRDLGIEFTTNSGPVQAVRNSSFTVMPGETVAIVGESGSGKSTSALAAIGLLPTNGRVNAGQIIFDGEDITHASEKRMVRLRGSQIGMVPQDPMSNLNPVWRIGFQVRETLKANGLSAKDQNIARVLSQAGLPDAEKRARQYPHEFSGGMRQRALISIGLSCQPRLLIADEPTSALDVTVQRTILDHLQSMTDELGTAVLLITHDLGLAAERAQKVVVMYKGQVVESGPALELLRSPRHPYTRKLVDSAPSLASRRIEIARAQGEEAEDLLAEHPKTEAQSVLQEDFVQVEELTKIYRLRGSWGRSEDFTAVDGVSFTIPRGTTTAVVGESGSGKSTVAKMMLGLEPITSGTIRFDGQDVASLRGRELFAFRRRVQPIFQDPYGSLDPMYNIYRTVEEPLKVHGVGSAKERERKVRELMDQVSLPQAMLARYPNELSGGQRQRVAIARALALNPDLVVCDEAVSALDVLVQAQILNLLAELQHELGLTYLFITHDLAVVRQIADRVCVMQKGRLVEAGSTDAVFSDPQTEYTRQLLEAIPGVGLMEAS